MNSYPSDRLNDIVFICKNQKKTMGNCNARLKKDILSGMFRRDGSAHNNPPELQLQQQVAFVNAVAQESLVSRDPPREIFDRIRRQFPELVDAFDGGVFFQGRVQTNDGGDAFVFISPKLFPEIAQTTELQADGTFRSLPILFKQLFTLHISRFGQAILRRVQKFDLTCANWSSPTVRLIVKELIGLALLPAGDILAGYQNIKNTYRDDLRRESTEIQAAVKRLMTTTSTTG
ncbi:hypothetical protein DAPPUDRAFT_253654 [Daphnia pulex]|uniref:Uncharacterized protein n=1 Tax=Daphnia pulex TaxID=6669 RepID=E9H5A3_DAPPU|nr:hypothetical protein DAPPUDRAFT_253654 [Daphnia pulex]|eukprot:EFX73095.1 hypothetical protein DAPPUDRAFT_253654 [Daphnia pulex]